MAYRRFGYSYLSLTSSPFLITPARLFGILSQPNIESSEAEVIIDWNHIIRPQTLVQPHNFQVFSIEHGKTHGVDGYFYTQASSRVRHLKLDKVGSY